MRQSSASTVRTRFSSGERTELELLRQALATSPEAFVSISEAGLIEEWNQASVDLLGWTREEVLGLPLAETIVPQELRAAHHAGLARYLATGTAVVSGRPVELPALHRDGTRVPVEVTIWPTWVQGRRRFHAFLRDLSPRHAAAQQLAASEARFEQITANVPGMVYELVVAPDGSMRFAYVSAASRDIYGLVPEEITADAAVIHEAIRPEDRDAFLAGSAEAGRTLQPWRWEGRITHTDGSRRWVQITSRPRRLPDGSLHYDGLVLDRTEAREAEEKIRVQAAELEQQRVFLEAVLANLSDAVVACDATATLTVFNASAAKLYGVTGELAPDEALPGGDWTRRVTLLTPQGQPIPEERSPLLRALRGADVHEQQLVIVPAGAPARTVMASGQQLRSSSGEVLGAVATLRDVTRALATQQEMARAEEQTRAAFETSPLGMAVCDESGEVIRVNPACCAMLARDDSDVLGRALAELTHPDDRAPGRPVTEDTATGAAQGGEQRFVRPDGSLVHTRTTVSAIRRPDGQRHHLVQLEDLSARRAAEADAERRTRSLLSTIEVQQAVAGASQDRNAVLQQVADAALTAFPAADGAVVELVAGDVLTYAATSGTLATRVGMRIPVAGSLSGVAMTGRAAVRCDDAGTDPRVNAETCRRVGAASMCIAPLFSGLQAIGVLKVSSARTHAFDAADAQQLQLLAGSLSAGLRHAEDYARNARLLTEQNAALGALEASEERFRLAFDNSPLGVVLMSLDPADAGAILQANLAMTEITGYSGRQLLDMAMHDLSHPDELEETAEIQGRLISGEFETLTLEKRYLHAGGRTIWMRVRAAVVHDEDGNPLYLVTQMEDFTAVRETQARLVQQARLLELIPAAVIVRDLDGTIRWWNAGAEATYGWPAAAAIGRSTHRLLTTSATTGTDLQQTQAALQADGHWEGELQRLRADGREVTVLSRQVLQQGLDGAAPVVLEINTDITDVRAAQRALVQSEERFRAQFTHSAVGQVLRGLDGAILDVNPAFAAMLGRSVDDLTGSDGDLLVDPDAAAALRVRTAELFAGEDDVSSQEERLRHADGHWVDVQSTVSLLRDETGRPRHLIDVVNDISTRKAAEAARDASAAELTERNSELEEANQLKLDLIGMLGHEISNPLMAILGYTELATDTWEEMAEDDRRGTLTVVHRNAQRLEGILREVLALVTLDAGQLSATPETVDVAHHVAAALTQAVGDSAPALDLPGGLSASVQPGHLEQILVNLLSNANKYGGGATRVVAARVGDRVEIRVEDHGPGVPEEFRDRLFDRFARAADTSGTVKGTGLGLYIVRELARANDGDVRYEPGAEVGSVFTLALPAAQR